MIGDKLVLTDFHRQGAARVMHSLRAKLDKGSVGVSVAGEAGSGKTGVAACLGELLDKEDYTFVILGQDDYFRLPPKANYLKRLEDAGWVGPQEVRLDLMDKHVKLLKRGKGIEKPLVLYEEDSIEAEVLPAGDYDVVICEGTYTSLLGQVDLRAFIDLDYTQTMQARLRTEREAEPNASFLLSVLEIEHQVISEHKARAQIIITGTHDDPALDA